MRLARGIHLIVVVLVAGFAAYLVALQLGVSGSTSFALFAAAVGGNAFLLTAPGTRLAEARDSARLSLLVFAVVAVAILIGWGGLGFGSLPVRIAWIFVIAGGLYCRRFGSTGMRYGLMVSLVFMMLALSNPTRAEAEWLLLAAAIGVVVTIALRLILRRPLALHGFEQQCDGLLRAAGADLLTDRRLPVPGPNGRSPSEIASWRERLARAAEAALAENPSEQARLTRIAGTALQVEMALRSFDEAARKAPAGQPDAKPVADVHQLAVEASELLSVSTEDNKAASDAFLAKLDDIRDRLAADTDLSWQEKFHLLRVIVGLIRVVAAGAEFRALVGAIGTPPDAADQTGPTTAPAVENLGGLGARLALQGFIAASVSTAIDFLFDLNHGYWATMTIFLVLSTSLGATVERSLQRAVGTSLGVVLAIAAHWLIGGSVALQAAVIIVVIAPIFVVFDRHYMIASAMIGFAVVMTFHLVAGLDAAGTLARLYETLLGVALALLVARFVFPIRMSSNLQPKLAGILTEAGDAVATATGPQAERGLPLTRLHHDLAGFAADLAGVDRERFFIRHAAPDSLQVRDNAYALADALTYYVDALRHLRNADIPPALREHETKLQERLVTALGTALEETLPQPDFDEIADRWAQDRAIVGNLPARGSVSVVESFHYGRKVYDALDQLRTAFARMRL